ncbi:RNA-binding protein 40-like [Plakobranchus ocellatus]|uniref:RNA-binding region-containing protein 3 n=1 Tax=Plakobranchus ocellatus TaxID=259542 RepID=A0AAV4E0R8_9GAST|nr:RNA-binding protein 40-like [Plakobranchus ocellatus]
MEESTLLFRHLPMELSDEERKDLLHYLGAIRVQVMGRAGSMKNTAFAVFKSREEASKIVKQLHQVEFLGSTLKVEFAQKGKSRVASVVDNEGVEHKEDPDQEASKKDDKSNPRQEPREIKFDDTFNVWGIKHVRRPDLYYLYPPPTATTLTNIMHALAAVPKFYVQVLHLMNKMDLPAPFGAVTPAPPLRPDVRGYAVTDNADQQEMDISSETESELESDEEERNKRTQDKIEATRQTTREKRADRKRKRPRLSELQESSATSQAEFAVGEAPSVREVFEQALSEYTAANRKIELKLPSHIHPRKAPPLPPPPPPPPPPAPSSSGVSHEIQILKKLSEGILDQPKTLQAPAGKPTSLDSGQSAEVTWSSGLHSLEVSGVPQRPVLSQPSQHLIPSSLIQLEHSTASAHMPENPYDVPLPPEYNRPLPTAPSGADLNQWQDVLHNDSSTYRDTDSNTARAEEQQQPVDAGEGGFGILQPQPRIQDANVAEEESVEKEWTKSKFISSSELKRSRLSTSEMKEYSVFRRYDEGDPSCRLYIKNLSKQTTEEDIHWIYGRYVDWENPTDTNIFDIRLMKEGRMKGQAFVTLPSEGAAALAVKETNGFMLKDKPMVVQFARSAKAQEDSASKP